LATQKRSAPFPARFLSSRGRDETAYCRLPSRPDFSSPRELDDSSELLDDPLMPPSLVERLEDEEPLCRELELPDDAL
jgi:hypothetical protein